jgi:hypothetical protein
MIHIILRHKNEKGEKILNALSSLLEEGGSRKEITHCSFSTNMTEDLPEKLKGMFEHPIWDEVGKCMCWMCYVYIWCVQPVLF